MVNSDHRCSSRSGSLAPAVPVVHRQFFIHSDVVCSIETPTVNPDVGALTVVDVTEYVAFETSVSKLVSNP